MEGAVSSSLPSTSTSPFNGKTMVFIRTSSPARLAWYEYLVSCGAKLIVFEPSKKDRPEFLEVFSASSNGAVWVEMETNNVDDLEVKLKEMIKNQVCAQPDAILSFDEYGVFPAAALAERLNCRPTPLPSSGMKATHVKSLFREWCHSHEGIHSPKCATLWTAADNMEEVFKQAGVSYPLVLKPSPGAGSMLAKKCDSLEEAKAHAAHAWKELQANKSLIHLEAFGPKVHIVAEEYIGGQEVDLDCVIERGKVRFCAISDNFEVEPPFFSEKGGILPSQLPADKQNELLQLLNSFVKSYEDKLSGVLHFEAKYDYTRGKPFIIEVNCRPGSAETDVLVSTVYGVALGQAHCRLALNLPIDDLLPKESTFPADLEGAKLDIKTINQAPKGIVAASVNIYPLASGTVKSMSAPTTAANFVDWRGLPAGRWVAPPPQMSGCVAWMVASGKDAADARANIERLTKEVVIILEE